MSHLEFMEMAGDALVHFDLAEWPSISDPILRAGDLPVDQRADVLRAPGLRANPAPVRASSSSDDNVDDPDEVPDAPAAVVPAPVLDAPAPVFDAPAPVPADVVMPAPHGAAPRRRNIDPACRLRPGNHTLVSIGGGKQRRCRVCHASGFRHDSSFMCSICQVALCRITDCSTRYHNLVVYWRTPERGVSVGRSVRRRRENPPEAQ